MTNTETIYAVIDYIKSVMDKRGITQAKLSEICELKKIRLPQSTISTALQTPLSTRISTLLKMCDGLDLNLEDIIHTIDISQPVLDQTPNNLIYQASSSEYLGYKGTYHILFLPTYENCDSGLVRGELEIKDSDSNGECDAKLTLYTGDLTPDKKPFIKKYEGNVVISKNGCIFCQLISQRYGDMWFLVFNHDNLNNKSLICAMGAGATSSSGKPRFPTVHRACICNKELYKELSEADLRKFEGLLRMHNEEIIISQQQLEEFMTQIPNDSRFYTNLNNYLNQAEVCFSIPRSILKSKVPSKEYAELLSLLLNYSILEKNYKIKDEDDGTLFALLKDHIS